MKETVKSTRSVGDGIGDVQMQVIDPPGSQYMMLVMEYMDRGPVLKTNEQAGFGRFTEEQAAEFFRHVSRAAVGTGAAMVPMAMIPMAGAACTHACCWLPAGSAGSGVAIALLPLNGNAVCVA